MIEPRIISKTIINAKESYFNMIESNFFTLYLLQFVIIEIAMGSKLEGPDLSCSAP